MRGWFADGVFRAVLRNAGYLGSTKLVGSGLGLIALACAGHALSPAVFGMLMIVHSYANGAGALVKFQTWQFIVQFGAPALERGDREKTCDVIRFAFGLDIASGIIGMLAAMALLPLLATWFGIVGDNLWLALAYCTLVPTMAAATPTGVLRVLDRFDLIAAQQIVTPALRGIGAVIAYFGHLGFAGFVVTWYVADLAGDVALWFLAVRELQARGMLSAMRPGLFSIGRRLNRAWSFVWMTNLAHSVYSAWGPVSSLIVGGMLGPTAAGLYKISSTLLDSASKPADLLARGFYPEIMRLDPSTRQPWQLGLRTGAIAGVLGVLVLLVVSVGGAPLITLVFGRKFAPASGLLTLMACSLAISMASFPLESLLYMVGRQRAALVAQLSAAVFYLVVLVILTHLLGLTGAGLAYVAGTMVTGLFTLAPTLESYRRRGAVAGLQLAGA